MEQEAQEEPQCGGYGPGHPWYYVLGGKALYPRQILQAVERSSYEGYLLAEIHRTDPLPEPRRSQALRSMRSKALADYRADLSRYREVVLRLHRHRAGQVNDGAPGCADIHQSVSLKHNHLFNDLVHLKKLAGLLNKQRDLFDF